MEGALKKLIQWVGQRAELSHTTVFLGDSQLLSIKHSGLQNKAYVQIELFEQGEISLSLFPPEMNSVIPVVASKIELFQLPNLIDSRFLVMEKILKRKEAFGFLAQAWKGNPAEVTVETSLLTLQTPVTGLEVSFFWNIQLLETGRINQSVKLLPGFQNAAALDDEDVRLLSNFDRLFHILLTKYDVLTAIQIIFDRLAVKKKD